MAKPLPVSTIHRAERDPFDANLWPWRVYAWSNPDYRPYEMLFDAKLSLDEVKAAAQVRLNALALTCERHVEYCRYAGFEKLIQGPKK